MDTPICDYVRSYAESTPLRLHMPGHKGFAVLGVEDRDITEISGADVLYQAEGIIRQSEQNAAGLFGTARTFYSTEGSTLCIRAMLYLVSMFAAQHGQTPRIAAGRNAHKSFITGAALLNLSVDWIYPIQSGSLLSCEITASRLQQYLDNCPQLPTAVYITSPDYLGNVADVQALSEVCHARGVLLLVDNAHGAYLRFLPQSRHPMSLGADLCCDSAHKTLPVLTGGAYLHVSLSAPALLADSAERALALFASTSPSYLIMQSLDNANRYLSSGYAHRLHQAAQRWDLVKARLDQNDYVLSGSEPLKLTLMPKSRGYTGTALADVLEAQHIICEFADPDYLVMMLSPEFDAAVAERLLQALLAIPARPAITQKAPLLPHPECVVSPHQALFLPSEEADAEASLGRVMASASVSCPPAIPIVSLGERIDQDALDAMRYYGIRRVHVLKGI